MQEKKYNNEFICNKVFKKFKKDELEILEIPDLPEDITYKELEKIYIKVKCLKCRSIFYSSFRSLVRSDHEKNLICKNCKIKSRYNLEYDKLCKKLLEYDLEALTTKQEYSGFSKPFKVHCLNCNNIHTIHPSSVREWWNVCKCKKDKRIEEVKNKKMLERKQKFTEKYPEFILLDANGKWGKVCHTKCGHIFKTNLQTFSRLKIKCPKCRKDLLLKESIENLAKKVKELHPDFTLVSFSGKWKEPCTIRHNTCNNTFKILPENFLIRGRCPNCDKHGSCGETKIKKYLDKHLIPYKREFSFSDLKDKLPLRFDFAIYDNDKIYCLMEFDGIQHFSTEKGAFGRDLNISEEYLEYQRQHAEKKNKYCKEHNLVLHRIRYDENIKERLDKIFNDYPNSSENLQ